MKEITARIEAIKKKVTEAILNLKLAERESELEILEEQSKVPNFWLDQENAKLVLQKINGLKLLISPWRKIEKDASEIQELLSQSINNEQFLNNIGEHVLEIEKELSKHENEVYLSGKYDSLDAILSIYAGAGGVDAQDWAEMLLSMFIKYAQRKKFVPTIIQISPGTEAGIKSVTVEIKGPFVYGMLKSERGVHRLVRISPYDADKARHTSFALVEVIPELEYTDSRIPEKDLRIETFRASGHGGQSVNTTDSAVRITHIPTGITVSCQNERSQLQNKETAMKILKARLQALEESEKEKEIRVIKGENISAEWGSQIRSYVLHPYQIVKDHRTGAETSNTNAVLNGNLDQFIESYLIKNNSKH